jgi:RHS repeat-associated protein
MPATAGYYPYPGEMDDVALYTRSLTAGEVAFRYQTGKTATARMTTVTNDQSHAVWQVDYDRTTGRVSSLTDTAGATWDLSDPQLDKEHRFVTLASSYGKSERYTYDAAHGGRLVSRSDAIGTATWAYNEQGFVSAYEDEVGLTTQYTTDDKGRRTEATVCRAEGDCSTSRTGYYTATDPFDLRDGRVLWQADGRSSSATDTAYRTTYTYNTKGQLLTTAFPGSAASASNPNGTAATTYTTGSEAAVGGGTVPAGLTATTTDASGAVTSYSYNKAGDLVETAAPSGQVTRYGYDLLGRLTTTQIGSYIGGQFSARDTVTETLDAVGHTVARTGTAFTNPVTGKTHRLQTTFTYDQFGRLAATSSWDEAAPTERRTTTYDYDAAGRLTATHYPDGSTAIQRWNTAGLLAAETTATGLELTYTYDERGRLLTTSAAGEGVDPADPNATELLLEYRTYYDNDWPASTTDALGRKTSWEYWGDGTVKRDLHTAPDGTETVTAQYDYDKAGNTTKVTDAVGTPTQTNYNARNWPTSTSIDPAGIANASHFAYDKTGRTTGITHKYGGTTYKVDTFAFNTAGALTDTWTTAPAVEGACVTVDARSCVVATSTNTYNSEGLLASARTGDDGAETYTYNSLGHVATVTGATRDVWVEGVKTSNQQPVTTYGYNAFGELTHHKDADGNVTETAYDTTGRPVRTLLPAAPAAGTTELLRPQILTAYRPGGLVASETDPRGATTAYEYDRYGRTLSVTQPDPDGGGAETSPVTEYVYDRAGQLLEQTDPNGALTTATYDAFGRNATVTATERVGSDLAHFTTAYTYDAAGLLKTSTTPGGDQTAYAYDALGRPTTITDPTGVTTTYQYPAATKNVTVFADAGDGIVRRQVNVTDVLGNMVKTTSETNPGSGWVTVQCAQSRYDLSGHVVAETTVQRRTCTTPDTAYTYDDAGQLTAITGTVSDTAAITVALGYDRLGHQTRMVDGNGNTTVYGFNAWGLQDTTIEPATAAHPDLADRTWTTAYDIAGNAVEQHLPGDVTQTATYDRLGRKTAESGTGAEAITVNKTYTWDKTGNLTGFSSELGDTHLTYNDRGLITAITGNSEATYTYDANGQLTERTDAAGTTAFTYDDAGRLSTLTDPLTNSTHTYQWRTDGQLASITSGQTVRSFTYGGYGELTLDKVTDPDGQQNSIAYAYDGQLLTGKTVTGLPNAGEQTYGYDGQGRLTSWTDHTGIETTYTWDGNSNRIAVHRWDTACADQAATTRLYVYDERSRLTEAMDGAVQCVQNGDTWQTQTVTPVVDETWTYTARGTAATHEDPEGVTTNYAFDAFEQLKTAAVDGTAVTNRYDALGRLIARNGAEFAYDGLSNNLIATPTGTGGVDRIVRDPAGGTVSQTQGGITGLSWSNTHGDLVAILNPATGDLIAGGGFDPFGNPLPNTTDTTIGFQGGYTDPITDETNAHARWYNPESGTFTSRDTWQLAPSPVTQTNRYLYGNASPGNYADPSGHLVQAAAVPVVAVGAALLGGYILGQAIKECYENKCNGALKRSSRRAWNNLEDWWEELRERNDENYGYRNDRTNRANRVYINRYGRPGDSGGKGTPGYGGGSSGGCGSCYSGEDSAGGGNPWRPAPPIDWNALETRPENSAQDAADDAPDEIDLLNDALMDNDALIDELEQENIIITDENGNIIDIAWRDSDQECKSDYFFGSAPNNRATGAVAYLCGNNIQSHGPGSDADSRVPIWGWPSENAKIPGVGDVWHRCHLVAKQLGGTGKRTENLVTCFGNPLNTPDMRDVIETPTRKQVESEGKHVLYVSIPSYNATELEGITVLAIGNRGYCEYAYFKNELVTGGMEIAQSC